MTDTPRRPRRTTSQLEHDIHAAVQATLLSDGYRGVTFEEVARRAQVSKPVLYRRYADRATMVLDTLKNELRGELGESGSTGSLRGDLLAWFSQARDRATLIGADTYRGLIGEADPTVLTAVSGIAKDATDLIRERIIDPAVDRGELGPVPLPDRILTIPLHLVRDSIVFEGVSPDIPDLVDAVALPLYQSATGS